jgi:CHAT domain-containing protein
MDGVLERLGAVLLEPMAEQLDGRSLVIVPHGNLHDVPFAALRLRGRYLVELSACSSAPSGLVYSLLRARRSRASGPPLVVGVGDDSIPRVRQEAREIAALFPGSRLLLGRQAGREAFAREAAGRRLVHIATHGLFRPAQPTLSALMMADGWLTLHDVFSLKLNAELVTLAACHSARSHVGAGDELMGLARGFLHAGAASVLVGQWAVDDASARRLMTSFYRAHAAGSSKTEALRRAMLEEMSRRPHPYYWAPFGIVGGA